MLRHYETILADKRREKRYDDVAYVEGYMNGLLFLLVPDSRLKSIPRYYAFGYQGDIRTLAEYKKVCKSHRLSAGAQKFAERLAAKLADGVEYHHTPFL
jgi:hypothetical protein